MTPKSVGYRRRAVRRAAHPQRDCPPAAQDVLHRSSAAAFFFFFTVPFCILSSVPYPTCVCVSYSLIDHSGPPPPSPGGEKGEGGGRTEQTNKRILQCTAPSKAVPTPFLLSLFCVAVTQSRLNATHVAPSLYGRCAPPSLFFFRLSCWCACVRAPLLSRPPCPHPHPHLRTLRQWATYAICVLSSLPRLLCLRLSV